MNTYHVTKLMGSDQLRNSFGKNDTMGPLKGISPPRYLNQFSLLSVHKCYENIIENMVFTQTISSGLMIFFLLFKLLFDCEVVLLWEIRKLINLESANFKLDPELSPLNDHTLIPCRTIKNFFSFHSEI